MALIRGTAGPDTLTGGDSADRIYGRGGSDLLDGRNGDDLLEGQGGADRLLGGAGRDALVGGPGADELNGGANNDVFLFRALSESLPAGRDTIAGFGRPGGAIGDVIDLSLIDGNTTRDGYQPFKWGGADSRGKGYIWVANSGDLTVVNGNVDNDATPEFSVAISDGSVQASAYSSEDFILKPKFDTWTFLSAPDMFNADYGDLSGGADPAIARIFGSGYASGLVRAPGWTPGGPNSLNPALAEVWKTNVERMIDSAGGSPEATLIAGDLVGGRWPQNAASLKPMFGNGSTTLEHDLITAASVYYTWMRKMWSLAGADNLIVALGDHDIGDNPWDVGSPRGASVNAMKQAFGTYMVDPLGLPTAWNGVPSRAPEGLGQYDEATYARQVQNVLFVTLDVFHYEGGAAVGGRNGAVSIDFTGSQLAWLSQILNAADADPNTEHVIIQGHAPILQPVDHLRSSNLLLQGGSSSDLWQLLADHGTNVGGKVRAYLAGEAHATTTIADSASGIVQIVHGASSKAEGEIQLDPTYVVFRVSEAEIVGTEYTIINDRSGNGSVFEVDDPMSNTVDTVGDGPVQIGTISIDVSSGTARTTVTGDMVSPRPFNNFIGGNGNDVASDFRHGFGQGGNDRLDGGAGNDRIDGGPGNDVLTGGTGDDILIGGPGSDRFTFSSGSGNDTIADFVLGTDEIAIPGGSFAALDIRPSDGGAVVEFDLGTIKVFGLAVGDLPPAAFDFLV